MSLSAVSSKFAGALDPWSVSSTSRASTASSTPSSRGSIWNGKPAPSNYLHKRLDVTTNDGFLTLVVPRPTLCTGEFETCDASHAPGEPPPGGLYGWKIGFARDSDYSRG